jgi:hypothetical protein
MQRGFETHRSILQRVQLWCPACSLEGGLNAIVCSHQHDLHQPTANNAEHRECYHQQHGLDIPRFFTSGEEIRAPVSTVSIRPISLPSHLRLSMAYHILPACPRTLMIAVAQALFSGVWLVVLAPHAKTRLLPVKQPAMYRKLAKYLAGTLRVATEMMNPVIATLIDMIICQPRSPSRSLLYAMAKVRRAPTR